MPDKPSQEAMNLFEHKLESELIRKKIGVLAATKTGKSQKEWRYYNSDPQKFITTLNEISDHSAPFPIDLQLFNDPFWEALSEIICQ